MNEEQTKKEKPCPDHWLLMPDDAPRHYRICEKCGWKEYSY
jgi:hypothetical protein